MTWKSLDKGGIHQVTSEFGRYKSYKDKSESDQILHQEMQNHSSVFPISRMFFFILLNFQGHDVWRSPCSFRMRFYHESPARQGYAIIGMTSRNAEFFKMIVIYAKYSRKYQNEIYIWFLKFMDFDLCIEIPCARVSFCEVKLNLLKTFANAYWHYARGHLLGETK